MEQYIIKGGHPLVGEVEIGGAKNAALAILAAAIMTDETVLIDNLPDVNDINVLIDAISEHYLESTDVPKLHFQEDAISEADQLTSISKDSVHLVQM